MKWGQRIFSKLVIPHLKTIDSLSCFPVEPKYSSEDTFYFIEKLQRNLDIYAQVYLKFYK